jgi:hypothetical protein
MAHIYIRASMGHRDFHWTSTSTMSDMENDEPSTNVHGKRVNALELGPRKKAYVVLLYIPYSVKLTHYH